MNGVHDMGGMHGMGPIRYEKDEPVFHWPWEGRVYAMNRAMGAWGKWNLDAWRHDIELLPPADYLHLSYYERWFAALEKRVVNYGFLTHNELESGKTAAGSSKAQPALTPGSGSDHRPGIPSSKDPSILPKFSIGQRIRARNINPVGHTRLPRYARGKLGQIHQDHGVYAFPDTNAQYRGEKRQHVYSVRFSARELWGDQASPVDSVYIDMWDDYLEQA